MNESELLRALEPIDGYLCHGQEWWLYQHARNLPPGSSIIEVGCYLGRSTAALALGAGTDKRVTSVDICQDHIDRARKNMEIVGVDVRFVCGDSALAPDELFDLAFIDGGHTFAEVEKDFLEIRRRMVPGGRIAFHDITDGWPDCLRFWNERARLELGNHDYCHSIASGTTL